ncbi:MAG: hypothetical protein ACYC36_03720 [Bellilinea sp.]
MNDQKTRRASGASRLSAGFDTAADDLAMFANQIREFEKGQGSLPHPWKIDDWLTDYRSRFARADKVSNG